jgi:hypothetical protein
MAFAVECGIDASFARVCVIVTLLALPATMALHIFRGMIAQLFSAAMECQHGKSVQGQDRFTPDMERLQLFAGWTRCGIPP